MVKAPEVVNGVLLSLQIFLNAFFIAFMSKTFNLMFLDCGPVTKLSKYAKSLVKTMIGA